MAFKGLQSTMDIKTTRNTHLQDNMSNNGIWSGDLSGLLRTGKQCFRAVYQGGETDLIKSIDSNVTNMNTISKCLKMLGFYKTF